MATQNMPDDPGFVGQRDVTAFYIDVVDQDFLTRSVTLHHPTVHGRQIATAAGFREEDVVVLRQSIEESIQRIAPNDLVNLRIDGGERFFVIPGDRTFFLTIDGRDLEWPQAKVTAETIRKLVRKDDGWLVYQRIEGEADQEITAHETVDLARNGIEHFVTKHHVKTVTVFYNHDPFQLQHRAYTTEQLLDAFSVPAGYILDLIAHDGEFVELKPGREILIKEGLQFVSHAPCGQSS